MTALILRGHRAGVVGVRIMIECRAVLPLEYDGQVVPAGGTFMAKPQLAAQLVSSGKARLVDHADLGILVDAMRKRQEDVPDHMRGRFVQAR